MLTLTHNNHILNSFKSSLLFWLVGITLIVWLYLQFYRPNFVQYKDEDGNPTGDVDVALVLGISLLVAFVLCLIFCLIFKSFRCY